MNGKKILAFALVLALAVGGVLLVRAKQARVAAAPTPTERPTAVHTATAQRGTLQDTRTYLARVEPWQSAELAAQITARVEQVTVREGDRVRRGEVLAILDAEELQSTLAEVAAQIAQAEAQVAAQEATVASLARTLVFWEKESERDHALAREGAIAQAAADATADRQSEARGRLDAARQTLTANQRQVEAFGQRYAAVEARRAYTRLVSPFDGLVARRLTDPGDLAAAGKALLVVEDRTRARLLFDLPQGEVPQVNLGTPVQVAQLPELSLEVSRLYPSLNPDRTRTVAADVPAAAGLVTGATYPVELVLATLEDAVLVPEECLVNAPDGTRAVFGVVEGQTRVFPVRVMLVRGGLAAVEGIDAGLPVIRSTYLGWNRLASGQSVEVLP